MRSSVWAKASGKGFAKVSAVKENCLHRSDGPSIAQHSHDMPIAVELLQPLEFG